MKRYFLPLACALASAAGAAAAVYPGNGNTGAGGVVGPGTLELTQVGATVNATFTRGGGAILSTEALVLYLDTRAGGIASTAGLTDAADQGRRAVSGFDGVNRSVVNFPTGFEPDFAVTVQSGFVAIFEIVVGGTHNFVASGNLTNADPVYSFDFDSGEVGASAGSSFAFVGTYLNANDAARFDEAIGDGIAAGNPVYAPVAFTGVRTFVSAPLPVVLLRLSAKPVATGVQLDWATATEHANAGFAIERSRDATTWTRVGFVHGFGESRHLRTYRYQDGGAPTGTLYYRLAQLDHDAGQTLSAVVSTTVADRDSGLRLIGVHPGPATGIQFVNAAATPLDVEVWAPNGQQRVARVRIAAGATVPFSEVALPAGVYALRHGDAARMVVVR